MSLKILKNSDGNPHACNVSNVVCLSEGVASGSDDGKIKLSEAGWRLANGVAVIWQTDLAGRKNVEGFPKAECDILKDKHARKSDGGSRTTIWKPDLDLVSEMDAPGGILSIAVSDHILYTCSTDESIQAWDLQAMKNAGKIQTTLFQPQKLFVDPTTKILWAGDSQGHVAKFENGKESGKFELVEEIWDLMITSNPNLVYTGRDRDVVVAEIVTGGEKTRVMVKSTFQGRSPFCVTGNLFCFLNRDGRVINVHENDVEKKFPQVREIKASELILNALAGAVGAEGGAVAFSGGYDSTVSKWDLTTGGSLGSVNLGCCINAIACRSPNEVYVARSDGFVTKVGS